MNFLENSLGPLYDLLDGNKIVGLICIVFTVYSFIAEVIEFWLKGPSLKEYLKKFVSKDENGNSGIRIRFLAAIITLILIVLVYNGAKNNEIENDTTSAIESTEVTTTGNNQLKTTETICKKGTKEKDKNRDKDKDKGGNEDEVTDEEDENFIKKLLDYFIDRDDSEEENTTTNISSAITTTESTTQEDTTTTEKESSTTTETTTEPVKPEDVEHYFDDTAKRKLDKKSAIEDLGGKKCEKKQFEGVLGELGETNKHTLTFDSDSLVWLEITVEKPAEKDKVGLVATLENNEGVAFLSFSTELNGENLISDKVFVLKGDYNVSVAQGNNYSGEKYNIILYSEDVTLCENEKNDRPSTATELEFKSDNEIATVYGVLSPERDFDFYGFEMTEDGHISIKFEHTDITDGGATWDIELWDEQSTQLHEFKIESSKRECVSADIGLNKGKYYIRVDGADVCASDIYAVTVCQKYGDNWEFEPNDADSSAKLIYDDKYYYGNITESDSEDYYKFVCKKTGSYSIKFMQYDATVNKTEENWGIKVMNERKDSVLENTLFLNYDASSVEDSFELYKGETYYIRISGNNYKKGSDYCFIIEKVD